MIYFDNAATTFPKPQRVHEEVYRCMSRYCGNPGRSSHRLSLEAASKIFECRSALAEMFGVPQPENVVFTQNTTYALNMAVKGLLSGGAHVLISDIEHNSVYRPVYARKAAGYGGFDIFPSRGGTENVIAEIKRLITPKTRMIVCTHASNICGITLPVREIGALCRERGIYFVLDAAQSAGMYDIDMVKMNIDALCAPSHKGLYGPQACGMLMLRENMQIKPLVEGGNGVYSADPGMPGFLPESLEAGTLPTPCIAGLLEGVNYIKSRGRGQLAAQVNRLGALMYDIIGNTPGLVLYAPEYGPSSVALFNVRGLSPDEVARRLDERGICVRAGLHCSPLAHNTLGTGGGAVRVSLGIFNNASELEFLAKSLKEIVSENGV